jgi:hypothetical protein
MITHMALVGDDQCFNCRLCGKQFSDYASLAIHMTLHD